MKPDFKRVLRAFDKKESGNRRSCPGCKGQGRVAYPHGHYDCKACNGRGYVIPSGIVPDDEILCIGCLDYHDGECFFEGQTCPVKETKLSAIPPEFFSTVPVGSGSSPGFYEGSWNDNESARYSRWVHTVGSELVTCSNCGEECERSDFKYCPHCGERMVVDK